jgi:hypothetical protein
VNLPRQPNDNTETAAMICALIVVVIPLVLCGVAIAINSILKSL